MVFLCPGILLEHLCMRVDVSMLVSLQVIDLCVLVLRLFRSWVVSRSSTVVRLHIRMAVNFVKDVHWALHWVFCCPNRPCDFGNYIVCAVLLNFLLVRRTPLDKGDNSNPLLPKQTLLTGKKLINTCSIEKVEVYFFFQTPLFSFILEGNSRWPILHWRLYWHPEGLRTQT